DTRWRGNQHYQPGTVARGSIDLDRVSAASHICDTLRSDVETGKIGFALNCGSCNDGFPVRRPNHVLRTSSAPPRLITTRSTADGVVEFGFEIRMLSSGLEIDYPQIGLGVGPHGFVQRCAEC